MFSSHENKLVSTTSSLVSSMEAKNLQCDMMSQKVCECTRYADYLVLSMWTPHSFPHLRVISIHLKNAKYTWKVNCLQQTQIWSCLQVIYSIGLKHCRSVRTYIHVYVYAILSERCFCVVSIHQLNCSRHFIDVQGDWATTHRQASSCPTTISWTPSTGGCGWLTILTLVKTHPMRHNTPHCMSIRPNLRHGAWMCELIIL